MKKQLILILCVILFIIPINAKAFSGSIGLSCDKTTLVAGESTNCSITGNASDDYMVTIDLSITSGTNLTVSDVSKSDKWEGANDSRLQLYTAADITGNFKIATFKLTAGNTPNSNTNINVSNVIFGTRESGKVSIGTKTLNIIVHTPSSDTSLRSLTVDGKPQVPGSTIRTDNSSVTIAAVANDASARVTGDTGSRQLNYGDNTFNIVVTAENGANKTYSIIIHRNDNRSNNAYLGSLSVSKGTIKFNRATYNYSVNVDTDVETIEIKASAEDSKATVTGTGTKKLKLGNNTFTVTVTAENESTKKYTIKVNRKDNRSSNNSLKELKPSSGTIDFKSEKEEYDLAVDYEVDKISFTATAEDDKSIIEGLDERALEVGNNLIEIKVKSENGSEKIYKINVIRNKEVIETNENKAKNITIKNHDFPFDPNKTEYVLETRLHELDINVELNSENSTFEITGNEDLHDGSLVQITITDQEGNNNIYTIKIYNPSEGIDDSNFLDAPIFNLPKYVYYIIIAICIIIIIILSVFVFQEKTNIRNMLKRHKHQHHQDEEEPNISNYNNGLLGEPTYETLEMAKIDLEDYLNEEQKAKHKKGIQKSKDELRDELASKIAILEDAENSQEEKNKLEEHQDEEVTINDIEVTSLIPVIGESDEATNEQLEEQDSTEKLEEPEAKPSRSKRKQNKKLELINTDNIIDDLVSTDDIDDLLKEKEEPTEKIIEKEEPVEEEPKPKTRVQKNKKNATKETESAEKEEPKEEIKEETPKSPSKKKKNKKKKNNSAKKNTKESKDELLDQILSKNYQKKD